jgi:hypothetical protein
MKKFVPQDEFEEFLKLRDDLGRTFLYWIHKFNPFKIAFEFLRSEFGIDFIQQLLLTGERFFLIQTSITEFMKVLSLFKNNFGKKFVKKILMRKDRWNNENFLLYNSYSVYSKPKNCSDLLKLFDLIFSIFGADSELFKDLFHSKPELSQTSFFEKLEATYYYEESKFKLITDWIEKNLGRNFLKK